MNGVVVVQDARQEATIVQLQQVYEGLAAALGGAAPESRSRRSGLTLVDHKQAAEGHHHWYAGQLNSCLPAPVHAMLWQLVGPFWQRCPDNPRVL